MNKKGTMTNKAYEAAAYDEAGNVKANGPRCATCGDLAEWGTHPGCERKGHKLVVWILGQEETKQ